MNGKNMETITITIDEYKNLKDLAGLNSDSALLLKLNKLLDLMYESRHGLFMEDYINDLTEQSVIDCWDEKPSPWDNV
jgi:hypothetical protein